MSVWTAQARALVSNPPQSLPTVLLFELCGSLPEPVPLACYDVEKAASCTRSCNVKAKDGCT